MSTSAIAGYLPERLIIRLGTEIRIVEKDGSPAPFPTPAAFAVFMHEYMHYLHNISTVCGLSGFMNTLELWRLFRRTIGSMGFSVGSSQLDGATQEHLKHLLHVLFAGRSAFRPSLLTVATPVSVEILRATLENKVESQHGTLLSTFACEAEVRDDHGTAESCQIEIGIPEIMEAAAWLLERRLASALAPVAAESPAPVFPYKPVSALAEHLLPGIPEGTILACILAAMQSSDPADGLQQILQIAKKETDKGRDPLDAIRNAAAGITTTNESKLLQCLSRIEAEFGGNGIMAVAIRTILSAARDALAWRRSNPFFEIELVDDIAARRLSIDKLMTQLPSCVVLQRNAGPDDELQRDLLASFRPLNDDCSDPEDGLRVTHAVFDFMGSHTGKGALMATENLPPRQCPFYTSCNLQLRTVEPSICSNSPWRAADWSGWTKQGLCWYATAVQITRPPQSNEL
jgi:hypothetical protein